MAAYMAPISTDSIFLRVMNATGFLSPNPVRATEAIATAR